jgi:hypothetical protein
MLYVLMFVVVLSIQTLSQSVVNASEWEQARSVLYIQLKGNSPPFIQVQSDIIQMEKCYNSSILAMQ